MANVFDSVNNALLRTLERLDEIDPSSEAGKAEIARSKAMCEACTCAVENANSTINALRIMQGVYGTEMPAPAILGCGSNDY